MQVALPPLARKEQSLTLQRKHPEDLQYPLTDDAAQAALQSLAPTKSIRSSLCDMEKLHVLLPKVDTNFVPTQGSSFTKLQRFSSKSKNLWKRAVRQSKEGRRMMHTMLSILKHARQLIPASSTLNSLAL
jgi:hypothetical protein